MFTIDFGKLKAHLLKQQAALDLMAEEIKSINKGGKSVRACLCEVAARIDSMDSGYVMDVPVVDEAGVDVLDNYGGSVTKEVDIEELIGVLAENCGVRLVYVHKKSVVRAVTDLS